MQRPKLVAKAVLVNEDGKVLVLWRSKTDPERAGRKDFPGGTVDDGEHIHEGVIREIDEEIGVNMTHEDITLLYTETTFFEGHNAIRFLYAGKLSKNTDIKISWEHDKFAWLTPHEALTDFDHPVWAKGLSYLLEHNLLPR